MPKFIEFFSYDEAVPVAVNVSTISRVYASKPGGNATVVLTTVSTEYYETVDGDEMPGASICDRVDVRETYFEVMQKIMS